MWVLTRARSSAAHAILRSAEFGFSGHRREKKMPRFCGLPQRRGLILPGFFERPLRIS
jgi:hypothetical protein